ncbi:tigger transposable element-derived protein 1-like [Malaya genurostris]|uniref:tigger transposable element-derived protein 1-like n=1 Tax=Malaya genurostris TaxID=325434 RepID=UPI0026F3D2D1|nr:tigger transposable element-derived protein 1-like [Malaya genurostris]
MTTIEALKSSKQRTSISLDKKLSILQCLSGGQTAASVARAFRLNESTIRSIKKNEAKITKAAIEGTVGSAKLSSYTRDPTMVKMEKALLLWIEDHAQKDIPLDGELIKNKALQLYGLLSNDGPCTSSAVRSFTASKGWFYKFMQRNSIRNVKLKGESASADTTAADHFKKTFMKIVDDGSYHADQIFNADETGLFWKKMPSRTFIAKSEQKASGFKAAKDRITLMFCCNASGDRMLKPLLIHKAKRPRALKNVQPKDYPVHWMSNRKAWMTKELFEQWFYDFFCTGSSGVFKQQGNGF